jgi:hypothetical protein
MEIDYINSTVQQQAGWQAGYKLGPSSSVGLCCKTLSASLRIGRPHQWLRQVVVQKSAAQQHSSLFPFERTSPANAVLRVEDGRSIGWLASESRQAS